MLEDLCRKGNPPTLLSPGEGNVNWFNHYAGQYGGFFKKLKIELLYDSAIPLLGVCPEKTII